MFRLKSNSGQGIVQVLIAMGIMSIMMVAMTSYMNNQARENRALSEQLAKLELERSMGMLLADGSICKSELTDILLNPASAAYRVNATSDLTLKKTAIDLTSIHAGTTPAATKFIEVDKAPSAMSNSMLVDTIQIKELLSTGVADRYLAKLEVSFKGTVRNQVPITLQKIIVTNSADPIGNKRIVDCLGAGSTGGPVNFTSVASSGTNIDAKYVTGYCSCSGIGFCYYDVHINGVIRTRMANHNDWGGADSFMIPIGIGDTYSITKSCAGTKTCSQTYFLVK